MALDAESKAVIECLRAMNPFGTLKTSTDLVERYRDKRGIVFFSLGSASFAIFPHGKQ